MMTNERVFFNTTYHVCKQTYYSIFACEKSISGCYNYNYLPKFTSFINCWITLSLSVLSFLGWFCSYYNSRVNAIIPSFSQLESGHFHPTHLGWLEAAQSLTHQYFSRLESHMATSALLHSFPIQFEDTVDCFQSLRSIQSCLLWYAGISYPKYYHFEKFLHSESVILHLLYRYINDLVQFYNPHSVHEGEHSPELWWWHHEVFEPKNTVQSQLQSRY